MQTTPEPSAQGPGVPEYLYPALGLPLPAATGASDEPATPQPPALHAPAERVATREKIVAAVLVAALVFLVGWWWGSRRSEPVEPALLIGGTAGPHGSLAELSDEELFALLPTEDDYPHGWKVSRVRGAANAPAEDSGSRLEPAECDPRKAAKPAGVVGSVKGQSRQALLAQTGSADVRLGRDPRGAGSFTAAEDFAKRCPSVTLSARGITAELRLTTERDTVQGAEESMTITMTGSLRSPQSPLDISIVMTVTGARCRGLMLVGTGMRAGFGLGLPGEGSEEDDEDVVGKLLRVTVGRINQR